MGVRNKHMVVPCPHCVCNAPPPTRLKRSFSDVHALLPDKERREREELASVERGLTTSEEEDEERGTTGRASVLHEVSGSGRTEKVGVVWSVLVIWLSWVIFQEDNQECCEDLHALPWLIHVVDGQML